MSIHNYLDLSTCHITEKDSQILTENKDLPFRVIPHEYGYWINVQSAVTMGVCKKHNLSSDFFKLIFIAFIKNCDWINLDRDSEIEKQLNVNNW